MDVHTWEVVESTELIVSNYRFCNPQVLEMSASRPFPASLQAVEWAQVVDDVGPVEEPKQPGTVLSFQGPMALAPLERKDDGHHPSAAYLPAP